MQFSDGEKNVIWEDKHSLSPVEGGACAYYDWKLGEGLDLQICLAVREVFGYVCVSVWV